MNWFPPRPLGTRIPNRLHAVSCSLPTMRDVIGYEKKDAATVAHMSSGYPRFVVHPMLVTLERAWRKKFDLGTEALWMVSSRRMGQRLIERLAPAPARLMCDDDVCGVAHVDDVELRKQARSFLQHTGGFLSSRQAEDYAVRHAIVNGAEPEELFAGDAAHEVHRACGRLLGLDLPGNIMLSPSGMNAFWATFQAIGQRQRAHGRDVWLQIGWLYLDTAAILTKFTGGRILRVFDVHDHAAIEAVFRTHGAQLAAVVTEVPTNPLMQTADLPWLAGLARRHGALMVVDPSIASLFNVDVLPHTDIVLNSLTKFAAPEGDVIAGAVTVAPRCPDGAALRDAIAAELEPVYDRDLRRLAQQIGEYESVVTQMNLGARRVIDYLTQRSHGGRGVRRVYWSLQEPSRASFLQLARGPDRVGPVFSLEVEGEMARFYDALPLAKGPSFGMRTTLVCPFVYLAHFDLISTPDGREVLAGAQLSPDLLRISIGTEPPEEIIAAFEQAFAAAGYP
jgi:cystathionine beta-lyase/cystathionine gamma-synthase